MESSITTETLGSVVTRDDLAYSVDYTLGSAYNYRGTCLHIGCNWRTPWGYNTIEAAALVVEDHVRKAHR